MRSSLAFNRRLFLLNEARAAARRLSRRFTTGVHARARPDLKCAARNLQLHASTCGSNSGRNGLVTDEGAAPRHFLPSAQVEELKNLPEQHRLAASSDIGPHGVFTPELLSTAQRTER